MDPSAVIRPARVEDADGIAEVHVASWRGAYEGLVPQELLDGQSVERRSEAWRQMLASGDRMTLVAVDETTDEVVGFIDVGASRDDDVDATVGELRAIYLRPTAWDRGVGRQLHDAGMELLRPGFAEATLWVLDSNARARAFYEKHGWHADGATKQDDRGDAVLSEVRYRLAL